MKKRARVYRSGTRCGKRNDKLHLRAAHLNRIEQKLRIPRDSPVLAPVNLYFAVLVHVPTGIVYWRRELTI